MKSRYSIVVVSAFLLSTQPTEAQAPLKVGITLIDDAAELEVRDTDNELQSLLKQRVQAAVAAWQARQESRLRHYSEIVRWLDADKRVATARLALASTPAERAKI